MRNLTVGAHAVIAVPASSANLGPGFDSLGIALDLWDEVEVTVVDPAQLAPGTSVLVAVRGEGSGAGDVPLDERHLVVRAIRRGLDAAGIAQPALKVQCRNVIPHSRGLGSSASAVVGGLAAAAALAGGLSSADLVQLAGEFEGHPDNASASVLGGAVVSWSEPGESATNYRAARLRVHPDIVPVAFIPSVRGSTEEARGLLPDHVPHADAAFNASRAALMVLALTERPELLLAATEDRLHQSQRGPGMPLTWRWVQRLRAAGIAAVISGAGPSVLAFTVGGLTPGLAAAATDEGMDVRELGIARGVHVL